VQFGGHCVVQVFTAFCFLATPLPPPAKAVVDNNAIAMMEKNIFFI
jgi:hypothetical protein